MFTKNLINLQYSIKSADNLFFLDKNPTYLIEPAVRPLPSTVFEPHRCSCSVTSLMKSGSVSQSSSSSVEGTIIWCPADAFHMILINSDTHKNTYTALSQKKKQELWTNASKVKLFIARLILFGLRLRSNNWTLLLWRTKFDIYFCISYEAVDWIKQCWQVVCNVGEEKKRILNESHHQYSDIQFSRVRSEKHDGAEQRARERCHFKKLRCRDGIEQPLLKNIQQWKHLMVLTIKLRVSWHDR